VSYTRIANARMYSVTPAVEQAWREVLERVAAEAGATFAYLPYPAPQPLEPLWSRADLGCVFMCGFPIAQQLAPVIPLAAPVPRAPWAGGRAVYRSDLIVRADSPWRTLEDSFAGRAGWTVEHSHSGFNAFRHHLLPHLRPGRERLYREVHGGLITARNVLDSVREGRIDIGPLDAYWHLLIARHQPSLVEGVRVLESTAVAPAPAFVTAPTTPVETVDALRASFADAARHHWFGEFADELLLDGFEPVDRSSYALTQAWAREAVEAGYPYPA
jgi:ABC-type phosphate/phosphonate transport system substrate-binding protein